MKKLLLLLLFCNISFSQPDGLGVEVRLIDETDWNDAGLVNILNSHNVTIFSHKFGHPYPGLQNRIYQAGGSNNMTSLLADLLNYTSVVESAAIIDAFTFSDCCTAQLLDANVGVPVGFSDDIVVTNDPDLNAIFQNFNVYYDVQTYPSSSWPSTLRYYSLACNCDAELLRQALDAYTDVIEATEPNVVGYLSVNENELAPIKIYPNPFKVTLEIDSANEIANYYVTDLTGKSVISSSSYDEFQSQLQNLNSGVYILKLQFNAGVFETRKIVKL